VTSAAAPRLRARRGRRFATLLALLAGLLLPVSPAAAAAPSLATTTIRSGLSNPWDIAFAPDGKMLVTERPGRIRVYRSGAKGAPLLHTTTVPNVRSEGESGLMGIAALRRDGVQYVIVCASRQVKAGWRNQVLRYRLFSGGRLTFQKVLLGGMRANTFHNGCAVEIGPDGKVWISMGDAGIHALAQSRSSRNGKILRIKYGGRVPSDNPFSGSPVYALGFRNPQGIAFHPRTHRAYSIEHGPEVNDEINLLRAGRNYGWPCWTGASTPGLGASGCKAASEYRKPAWASGGSTLATSGGTFVFGSAWAGWRNDLFVATLKQADLRRFHISDSGYTASQQSVLFNERWGRLRASVVTPSGRALYLTTSNGGGTDRVIRVRPR
jgi:glucose/arabinose dehydrogenase